MMAAAHSTGENIVFLLFVAAMVVIGDHKQHLRKARGAGSA